MAVWRRRGPFGSLSCLLVLISFVASAPSLADDKKPILGGPQKPPSTGQKPDENVCVGVEIGADKADALSCLNAEMRGRVQTSRRQANQTDEVAGAGTNATPTATNLFNQSATRERLGDAFGHSVYPQRLPLQKTLLFFDAKKP